MCNHRGKKPKNIHCCDISLRNELAVGHETGDISIWKLDLDAKVFELLQILKIDSNIVK